MFRGILRQPSNYRLWRPLAPGRWRLAAWLTRTAGAVCAAALATGPASGAGAPAPALVLRPGQVWTAGEALHEGWVVLTSGARIVAVGPAAAVHADADAQLIDLPGATLLPGLIDAHAHLFLHPTTRLRGTIRC